MPLVVCYTPLHVFIVESLIRHGFLKEFCLVYICFDQSPKHEFYFERVKPLASKAVLVRMSHNPLLDAVRLLWIRFRGLGGVRVSSLLTGNLKHLYSRALMLLYSLRSLSTFDDGSGNVSGSGYFYEKEERGISRLLFSLTAPRLLYRNAIASIRRHFTIYSYPNVYDGLAGEVVHVSLLQAGDGGNGGRGGEKVFYLGNVFAGDGLCSASYELQLDRYVLERYAVSRVIPHPRRADMQDFVAAGCELIRSSRIAEEIIFDELRSGVSVHLVGCYSSALLNLSGVPGVRVTNVCCRIKKPVASIESHLEAAGASLDREFEAAD